MELTVDATRPRGSCIRLDMNSRGTIVALFVLGLCCMNPLAVVSPRVLLGMIALAGALVAAVDCAVERRFSLRLLLTLVGLASLAIALIFGGRS